MKKIEFISLIVLVLFLVGCTSGVNTPKEGPTIPQEPVGASPDSGDIGGDLEGLDGLEGDLGLDDLEDLGNEFSL